jgi:hypothetical protein
MVAKKVFFKRREYEFPTQEACKEHLKQMREKYNNGTEKSYVTEIDDINDLKDFLEDYYGIVHPEDFKEIQADYLLDGCKFYLAKSKEHSNYYCFYIEMNGKSRDFSTSKFYSHPPTPKQNFSKCCRFIIERKYDKERKKEKLEELKQQGSFDSSKKYTLHLVEPKWGDIVDDFIAEYRLSDKLADIITPNGSGNEIPEFLSEYQFLEQKFLEFFRQKNPVHELRCK